MAERVFKKTGLFFSILLLSVILSRAAVTARGEEAESGVQDSQGIVETVDPIGDADSFSAVLYNNRNGLPTSEANDVAETSNGFLWIACYSGLIRYDGNRFERINPFNPGISTARCLYVDALDRLWIGTNDNGLAMLEGGMFRRWREADGLIAEKINDITADESGTIYLATPAGVQMIDEEMNFSVIEDPRTSGLYVDMLRTGSDGMIYGMSSEDDFFTLRDGEVVHYMSSGEGGTGGISLVVPDPKSPGQVFAADGDSNFYYGSLDSGLTSIGTVDISPLTEVSNIEQIGDRIWICGRNGIGVIAKGKFHYLSGLPMNGSVTHVWRDYEGNLWFTSSRQGLMKIVRNRFLDIFERYRLSEMVVNTTCKYEGKLLIGTDKGLIALNQDGIVSEIPLTEAKTAAGEDLGETDLVEMLDGCRIRSIIRDSRGRAWISTWRACGLLCYEAGKVTAFSTPEGLLSDHVRTVYERRDGSFLVVCSGGVSIIEDGRVTVSYGEEDGIRNVESLTVSEAENGDILLGSNGGGIYVINKEGVRVIGVRDGLPSAIVMRIKRDPARNIFWLVASNGLAYMTADYQVTSVDQFPSNNNFDMFENSRGEMWVLSGDGIYILPTEKLLANSDINPLHYGLANGLPYIATSNSYSELTEEGNLYIAGNAGVARINIDQPMESVSDLKIAVPYLKIDDQVVFPDETGSFTIPPRVHKMTVNGFVFNYSLTDPGISYYLEGFDKEKEIVTRSEFGPVEYTNLPGGSYRFVIELMDLQGNTSGSLSVSITKEKALYEQPWFYIITALAGVICLQILVRRYVHRKTIALEEKNREEVRKERLKTELKMASRIQEGTLPRVFPPFPDRKEFDLYAMMDPAREVGGDFYDFYLIDEDHLCLVIADVSGKGIPAALFMMISKIVVENCARLGKSAAEILTRTNEAICDHNKAEMFVTIWVGILEISTGKISAANAGHEYPAVQKNGTFTLLRDRHGLVIGGMDGVKYREYEMSLNPGDKLFVYTDGVPEAADKNNNMFGTDRMLQALNSCADAPPERILEQVRRAVNHFVGDAEQFDDLTMLCLEYHGVRA